MTSAATSAHDRARPGAGERRRRGEARVHLGNDLLAPLGLADQARHLADVRAHLIDAARDAELDQRDRRALEQRHGGARRERAGDHQVRIERDDLLGKSVVHRHARRDLRHVRAALPAREPGDRRDPCRIGQPQQQVVGAHVERDDARRLGRLGARRGGRRRKRDDDRRDDAWPLRWAHFLQRTGAHFAGKCSIDWQDGFRQKCRAPDARNRSS